ncbi:glycerol-3-phosphate acyltransferase 3-like isoform X3 [Macrobrachium rosenbergii]
MMLDSFPEVLKYVADYQLLVWETLRPVILGGQVLAFFYFLLAATIGGRLKLRKKYIDLLDHVFNFASFTLSESPEEEDDEDLASLEEEEDEGVVISSESPSAGSVSATGSFSFQDAIPYITAGMRAVVQDCVLTSFTKPELHTWNMLSRTIRRRNLRQSPSLIAFWLVGFIIRWAILMPVRVFLFLISLPTLIVLCIAVGLLPDSKIKKKINAQVVMWSFDFVAGSLSVVARFHNTENRPTHGIAVANHTSPIDTMVLSTDQCYDMVGQKSKGILGVFMTALSRSSSHIWFDRKETRERSKVAQMLQSHAQDTTKPPILIFPEGICVNNTAVLQFKKGAFEIDSVIYPVAIRFDRRYGDAFWQEDHFGGHIFNMMTSWAIVCDVWYLPPMRRAENESAAAFANRVRALIAHRGGFVELAWDGSIKLAQGSTEGWKEKQQQLRKRQQIQYARNLSQSDDESVIKAA